MFKYPLLIVFSLAFILRECTSSTQTCHLSYILADDPSSRNLAYCRTSESVMYACSRKCRTNNDSVNNTLFFVNCDNYTMGKRIKYIWPTDFRVSSEGDALTVVHGKKSDDIHGPRSDVQGDTFCFWKIPLEHNRLRPTCDDCNPMSH
ncbi:hypothetical protein O181_045964 [Austropuccinia psidii MF-1]|uniref:Secreted protein n=1 Tax=Austropuccinia psidii MF-1 TaxID=1389203 RepID=A0A9Q3DN67_9BASI|nr:hypothetical protein [Austropuccinia psidii MF-1]